MLSIILFGIWVLLHFILWLRLCSLAIHRFNLLWWKLIFVSVSVILTCVCWPVSITLVLTLKLQCCIDLNYKTKLLHFLTDPTYYLSCLCNLLSNKDVHFSYLQTGDGWIFSSFLTRSFWIVMADCTRELPFKAFGP